MGRKVREVQCPRLCVRFEAGTERRRKRRIGEGADCDPDNVRCDGDVPVHGRPALRAEVIGGPPAVAGAKRGWLRAFDGKRPRSRFALYRHLLPRDSRLHTVHAACAPLALVATTHRDALWIGTFHRQAEPSASADLRARSGYIHPPSPATGCARLESREMNGVQMLGGSKGGSKTVESAR